MRRLIFLSLAAAAAAGGCDESTGPTLVAQSYALARIGLQLPPIPGPDGGAPFLLADTLRLQDDRPREETGLVLTRISVIRDGNGATHRMETEHAYQLEGNLLTYDSCPRDLLCAASLVYAPIAFQVVGDSLFQTGPPGLPVPGAVYGKVPR